MGGLYQNIVHPDRILAAYHLIREKHHDPEMGVYRRFTTGIDGVDLIEFDKQLEERLEECRVFLMDRGLPFYPQILRKVPKDNGEMREVYISALRDKVIQKAMADVLSPWMERHYHPNLYSYRKGRFYGNGPAARKVHKLFSQAPDGLWVFKTDIPSYTDGIAQTLLLQKFRNILPDEPEVMELLEKFVHQRKCSHGIISSPIHGIPSGSSLTPICANFYLADLDRAMFVKRFEYTRFGDDILLLADTEERLHAGIDVIKGYLEAHGLKLSEEKTVLAKPGEAFEYLGNQFQGAEIEVGSKAVRKYREWIRDQLPRRRYRHLSNATPGDRKRFLKQIVTDLNARCDRGMAQLPWIRSFPVVNRDERLRELDRYIKSRIRRCILRESTPRDRELVPEAWFREVGYKSVVGAYYRINRRRPLGPYTGWRKYYGTNYVEQLAEHQPVSFLTLKWREARSFLRFVKTNFFGAQTK